MDTDQAPEALPCQVSARHMVYKYSAGFVIPPFIWTLLPYLLGALAVLGAVTWIYQALDNSWPTDAGIEEGRKRERMDLEPQLAACRVQEQAVSDMVKEGEERRARAQNALKTAQEGARTHQAEAVRLRGLAGTQAPTACPAGSAVEEIRRGLR